MALNRPVIVPGAITATCVVCCKRWKPRGSQIRFGDPSTYIALTIFIFYPYYPAASHSRRRANQTKVTTYVRFSILTKELELWNIIICFFFQITLDESIMKCEIFYFGPLDLVRVDWTKMIVFYVRSMQFRKRIYLISSVTLLTLCWIILFPLKVKTSEYFFLFKQNYNYYRDIKVQFLWFDNQRIRINGK